MSDRPKQIAETSGEGKIKRPATSEMVNTAIRNLNDRGGSSIKAITKYMETNYPIEVKNFMPYIKAHIKKSLVNGTIVQASGVGLNGSFKLSKKVPETKKQKEKQNASKKIKEGDPEKEKVNKSKEKKAKSSSANGSKSGKSGTKKTKESAENVKDKNETKVKNDKIKKAKTKPKPVSVKEGKVNKGEVKKPKAKTVTTTDPAKLRKIRISILNGKLIKRKSVGPKIKKSKAKKAVEES